jgi:hypothetical protein
VPGRWADHDKKAKEAAAQLQKVHPGFTVQTFAGGISATTRPTTNARASPRACARLACRKGVAKAD